MHIEQANKKDVDLLAKIVSESNKDVADMFGLNKTNAPRHPSFCKPEWILTEIERNQLFFIYNHDDVTKGCVAFEQPNENTAYLNRLSVLPQYRKKGIGSELVRHILRFSKEKGLREVSIGIIADHTRLMKWYQNLGFNKGAVQQFAHLPFKVLYMKYETKNPNRYL